MVRSFVFGPERRSIRKDGRGREGKVVRSGFKKRFRTWAVAWEGQGHGNRQTALGLDASEAMRSWCYKERSFNHHQPPFPLSRCAWASVVQHCKSCVLGNT